MAKLKKVKAKGVYSEPGGTYYIKYNNNTKRNFKTIAAAELYIAKLKLEKNEFNEADLTFDILAEMYIEYEEQRYLEHSITYGTYKEKERIYRLHIKDNAKNFNFKDMTGLKMRKIRTRIFELELATIHKNNILAILKSILDHGRRFYEVKVDYTIFLENFTLTPEEKKKNRNRLEYVWTNNDFSLFLSKVRDQERKIVYTLFYKHGMRIGETRALLWESLDSKKYTLKIDGGMSRKNKEKIDRRTSTKTDGSNRTIYIGKTSTDMLLDYKKTREPLYNFDESWFIFGDSKRPISEKKINNERIQAIKAASIPYATNHDMRHMFVSNAWSTVPITALSAYLGHRNVAVTLEHYTHLSVKDNDKMIEYIEDVILEKI